jgi:serine/threonine protein kinase
MNTVNFTGREIGNYRIVAVIDSGTFGTVYRAEHLVLSKRVVAIKVLHAYLGSMAEREQFRQEAQFLEKLRHPHVLSILDIGFAEGFGYLITEYAANGSLRDLLRRQSDRPLPTEQALSILTQVGQALDYAHQQNIIHRDLKPENILFTAEGNALLADFGIAVVLATASMKLIDNIGTPSYMAPEQFRGIVSKEADQYALGCIAYELLTGRRPFTAPDFISMGFMHANELPRPPTQYNPQIPSALEGALLKALAKERADRYSSVSDFIHTLQKSVTRPIAPLDHTRARWLIEGNTLYGLGHYPEALNAYEQALCLDPNSVLAYNGKGNALGSLRRYPEALEAFEQALRLDHNSVAAYNGKGNALRVLKRYQEALEAYEQAIRLDPSFAFAYYGKGRALYNLKRHKEALKAYEQALRLDPNSAFTYHGIGNSLYELKRYQEALRAYEQAIRLDHSYVAAYCGKGQALYELKRCQQALEAFEQALRLDHNSVVAYNGKGHVLGCLKRYQEALDAFEQALRLDHNSVAAHDGKGNALRALKRYQEALEAYEQALRLDPSFAFAYYGKGDTLSDLGRYLEAKEAYEQAHHLSFGRSHRW